jgi:integrase/recombinase XerC
MTLPTPAEATTTLREGAANELLYTFLTGRSETTLRAYRRDLEDFRRFTRDATISAATERLLRGGRAVSHQLVLNYRARLMERGLQAATINRRIAALRSLVKMARLVGFVTWSLEVSGVRSEPYRDTRGPGRAAVALLFDAAAEADARRAARDQAILHLLYDLGLRRGELVALDVEDVDLDRSALAVRGKGRSEKSFLTLPAPTVAVLADWLSYRGGIPGPLFTNFDRARKGDGRLTAGHVYKIVRGLGERVGVRAAPHGLRHTAITEACKAAQAAGIGLDEVLDFSRHKDVKVLMLYRDRERNVQGQLAALIAGTVSEDKEDKTGRPEERP